MCVCVMLLTRDKDDKIRILEKHSCLNVSLILKKYAPTCVSDYMSFHMNNLYEHVLWNHPLLFI